jgi:hypothetical protein
MTRDQFIRLLTVQVLVIAAFIAGCATTRNANPVADSLRVRELVVVDAKGVVRARIGGDLPDAIIGGKRVPRGEQAAGVLLYDAAGHERGGYVTWEPSGNVGLTLDTHRGQVAVLVADRESGAALQLWNRGDAVELRSDDDGSRLTASKSGRVVVQQPEVAAMTAETCNAYKATQSMRDCQRRFTDAACRACLGATASAPPPP